MVLDLAELRAHRASQTSTKEPNAQMHRGSQVSVWGPGESTERGLDTFPTRGDSSSGEKNEQGPALLIGRKGAHPLGRGPSRPLSKERHCPSSSLPLLRHRVVKRRVQSRKVPRGREPLTGEGGVPGSLLTHPRVPSPEQDKVHTVSTCFRGWAPNDPSVPPRCLFQCRYSPTPFINMKC